MTLRISPVELVRRAEESGSSSLVARHPAWPRVPLSHVARVTNGAPFDSRFFNVEGRGVPLIRIRDVGASRGTTWYDGPWDPEYLVEPGTLLVGMDGDFRAASWHGPRGVLNQRVCRIDPTSPNYDPRFLALVLQGYLELIWNATSATTVKHLSSRSVGEIPLPCPPIEEQRHIVAILEEHLSDLDDAAAGLRRAGAKSTAMVAAARRTAVERAAEVGEPTTVGQRAILVEYGTSHKAHEDPGEGDIPVLRMGNVQDGRIEFAPLKYLSPAAPGVRNLLLKRGDLLFNRTNSAELVGKSAVFEADIEATFASYLIRVRFNSSVRPEWASIVVNSPQGRAYITAIASQQVGQANVNGTKLKAFPLPVPSLADQDEFIQSFREFESAAERLRAQTSRSLARTASLRRAVLTAAFSGRLTGRGSDTNVIEKLAEEESA